MRCRVQVVGNVAHTLQVVTGFVMLHRRGSADVSFDVAPAAGEGAAVVTATVNGRVRVVYDMVDNATLVGDRDADAYFKRSYDPARHGDANVHPFGLNYGVTCDARVFDLMANAHRAHRRVGDGAGASVCQHRVMAVEEFEAAPHVGERPTVLFMTRLWDPCGEPGEGDNWRTEENRYGRDRLNAMRLACLEALADGFGERFVGGLRDTPYARRRAPDLVLDPEQTSRPRFVRAVHAAAIGISTRGLEGSNPWKLAEYCAASRAVVSEALAYEVPGLVPRLHYLDFRTPEECCARVQHLLDSPAAIVRMQVANQGFYRAFVRPDAVVERSLRISTGNLT